MQVTLIQLDRNSLQISIYDKLGLFKTVVYNTQHVLHHLLPDRTLLYTLRPRRHDCAQCVG